MHLVPANTLVREYSFITSSDPALVEDAEAYRLYSERGDESHLKFKSGEQPTRWKLRHVTGRANKLLTGMLSDSSGETSKWTQACWIACQHGLVGATNLLTAEGGEFQFQQTRCPETKASIITEACLTQIDSIPPYSLVYEIGGHILGRLQLGPLS